MHNAIEGLFCPPEAWDAFGDVAWVAAMLRFEAALAQAQGAAGVIDAAVASRIVAACDVARFDVRQIGLDGAKSASLAVPLVAQLRRQLHPSDAAFVHLGATSQDVLDTAQALLSVPVLDRLVADAQALTRTLLATAREHARTPMLARTLMQSASVTSFGLKCALWAVSIASALRRVKASRLQAMRLQLGGAVGTQAQLRGASADPTASARVVADVAARLGLGVAANPWHTQRGEWVGLGLDLALLAGSLGKIGVDWALMMQFEVGELALSPSAGGESSAMPHKRNPVACAVAKGVALRGPQRAAALLAAMPQEHERALGAWQAELAEWPGLLCAVAASARALAEASGQLQVSATRMMANLDAVRLAVDGATAELWFDANLANDAGEQALALVAAIEKELG